MYNTSNHQSARARQRHAQGEDNYLTESAQRILTAMTALASVNPAETNLHFTMGIVERIERQMHLGLNIIADTPLVQAGINTGVSPELKVSFNCYLEDNAVVRQATAQKSTRAEIAVDMANALPGPKLFVIGSAPMALRRLIRLHQNASLRDTVIVATPSGFASVIELKERLWESALPCIVSRGRAGGAGIAIALVRALMNDAIMQSI